MFISFFLFSISEYGIMYSLPSLIIFILLSNNFSFLSFPSQFLESDIHIDDKEEFSLYISFGLPTIDIPFICSIAEKRRNNYDFVSIITLNLKPNTNGKGHGVIGYDPYYFRWDSDTLEETKESLEVINRHAKRMTNLINQIMELSKLERQKEIEKEKINLSNIVLQLLEDYKPLLESKNLNLIYNVEKDIRIQGNKIMLERVFLNILMNAVKFTKTNIEVSLTREDKTAVLKIRDNGIGISEENKKFIWERFFQVNDSRNKEENKGSGLGLSMVKKIVDLHSATIDLESELEQGTCFTIKFNM